MKELQKPKCQSGSMVCPKKSKEVSATKQRKGRVEKVESEK